MSSVEVRVMYREMTERLEQAFEYSAIWHFEMVDDRVEELTEEDGRDINTFRALEISVKEISPALMQDTADLAAKHPEVFEQSLITLCGSVCDQFRPATAAEFVEQLNTFIRQNTAALAPG
jgi:predicted component of type VI protein secretion system